VRSLTPVTGSEGGRFLLRCGVEFEPLAEEARNILADDVIRSSRPSLANTNGLRFATLWSFLAESGFLYPEKLHELAPMLPQIEHTFASLLQNPKNSLLKTIVCRRNEAILGHISTLRLYRKTWLIQHLASLPQVDALFAAEVLNLGLIEYLEQMPELEWCRVFFRPNNRWPARVFGTFARRLAEPSLSDLRKFHYCVGPTSTVSEAPWGFRIFEAKRTHLEEIQRFFLSQGRLIALQADDLSLDRLRLTEIQRLYDLSGLERRREILVAERGSSFAGFALLEVSSPGLNLSELTNHFSVHTPGEDPEAQRALILAARRRYAALGRAMCVSLSENDDFKIHEEAGLHKLKEYLCWTGHRSLLRAYSDYVLRLFGQVKL
jgi:hypothetical protein